MLATRYEPAVKVGQSPKLHCPWGQEPFEVIQKVSEVDYKIRKGRLKPKIVHFNRLKVFVEREEEGDERENGDVNPGCLPKRNGDVRENNRRTEIGEKTAQELQLAAPRKDGGCQKKIELENTLTQTKNQTMELTILMGRA
jgi:hypothetical protein